MPICCRKGVVLVNPATSYSRTLWSKLGPVIARLPQPLYTLGMLPIGLLLLDAGQVKKPASGWMGGCHRGSVERQ